MTDQVRIGSSSAPWRRTPFVSLFQVAVPSMALAIATLIVSLLLWNDPMSLLFVAVAGGGIIYSDFFLAWHRLRPIDPKT